MSFFRSSTKSKSWKESSVNITRCRFSSPKINLERWEWIRSMQNNSKYADGLFLTPDMRLNLERVFLPMGRKRIYGELNYNPKGWGVFWTMDYSERVAEWITGDGGSSSIALPWELAQFWELSSSAAFWFVKKLINLLCLVILFFSSNFKR